MSHEFNSPLNVILNGFDCTLLWECHSEVADVFLATGCIAIAVLDSPPHDEHRAIQFLHSLLSAVKDIASSQDSPPFSKSLMTTCCQVTRGRPHFLLSSGTQCSTILSSLILCTCPCHLNRHSWTDSSNFSWPVCSRILS